MKIKSTLNDKNAHVFSMFCDLCVTRMVRFRLKSILVVIIITRFVGLLKMSFAMLDGKNCKGKIIISSCDVISFVIEWK